jgi:uncharacterized protein YecE (DUF72 family)
VSIRFNLEPTGRCPAASRDYSTGVIRFGPAGWDYEDWAGVVYPRPRPRGFHPLAWLASYFDVVEVNSTFYRPQPAEVARAWLDRAAPFPRFRFTAKVWRRLTHERAAYGAAEVAEARAALDVLHGAGRLGAALLQFPWSFKRAPASEEWLRDLFRALEGLPLALEVRHESWNVPEVFAELAERGVGFVNVDQPLFARSIAPSARATSRVGYVRVHGRNYRDWFRRGAGRDARYDYLYTADELAPWADRVKEVAAEPRCAEVYVVTNNHFEGKAVANAAMLASLVEARRVPAPPPLVARYRELLAPFAVPAEPEPRPPAPRQGGLFG